MIWVQASSPRFEYWVALWIWNLNLYLEINNNEIEVQCGRAPKWSTRCSNSLSRPNATPKILDSRFKKTRSSRLCPPRSTLKLGFSPHDLYCSRDPILIHLNKIFSKISSNLKSIVKSRYFEVSHLFPVSCIDTTCVFNYNRNNRKCIYSYNCATLASKLAEFAYTYQRQKQEFQSL